MDQWICIWAQSNVIKVEVQHVAAMSSGLLACVGHVLWWNNKRVLSLLNSSDKVNSKAVCPTARGTMKDNCQFLLLRGDPSGLPQALLENHFRILCCSHLEMIAWRLRWQLMHWNMLNNDSTVKGMRSLRGHMKKNEQTSVLAQPPLLRKQYDINSWIDWCMHTKMCEKKF